MDRSSQYFVGWFADWKEAMKPNQEFVFKGYDYMELAEALGLQLPHESYLINFSDAGWLAGCLELVKLEEDTVPVAAVLRRFLRALVEFDKEAFANPVWLGLIAVEDDYTFMQLFIPLVGRMWN